MRTVGANEQRDGNAVSSAIGRSASAGIDQSEHDIVVDPGLTGRDQHAGLLDQPRGTTGRDQLQAGAVPGDVDGRTGPEPERVAQRLRNDDPTDRVDLCLHRENATSHFPVRPVREDRRVTERGNVDEPRRWSYLMDMDGVLVHEEHMIPGADVFIAELTARGRQLRRRHQQPASTPGVTCGPGCWPAGWTFPRTGSGPRRWPPPSSCTRSGRAAAPSSSARSGLTTAMHEAGYVLTDREPRLRGARRDPHLLVRGDHHRDPADRGRCRFVATNPDPTGPSRAGAAAGGRCGRRADREGHRTTPYFVGKPNPLMMRSALRAIGAHSESTLMIGDRMDTDVIAGLEAGLPTILVLTGISTPTTVEQFPFRPSLVINSVADLIGRTADPFSTPAAI